MIAWSSVDSKKDILTSINKEYIECEFVTEDPNQWGFFKLPNGKIIVIGFANLGLSPAAIVVKDQLFIGINELLVSFDIANMKKKFTYRMPTIFHEFVEVKDSIIVRDEIGFVCISFKGEEYWKFLVNGPIDKFSIQDGIIHGSTIDNEEFLYEINPRKMNPRANQ